MAGNCAAALYMGSRILATAKLLGDMIGKSDSLVLLLFGYGVGTAVLHLATIIIRLMFIFVVDGVNAGSLKKRHVLCSGVPFKTNISHALVEGTCLIMMAGIIGTFLRSCNCYHIHFLELNRVN